MAFVLDDRVKETSTTTGTGNFTLAGAVSKFLAFSARMVNNDTTYYCIEHQSANEWEVGLGTWTTGGILVRTTVLKSSNSDAAVNFSAGDKHVFITLPGTKALARDVSGILLSETFTNIKITGDFDIPEKTPPTSVPADTVRLFAYDDNTNTRLAYRLPDGTTVQIARDNIAVVKNVEGATINKGQVVYISGGVGASGTAEVRLARANAPGTMPAAGIVMESIANNGFGRVMLMGKLEDFDTSAFSQGDSLFVSQSTAGALTATAPTYPDFVQRVAVVINSHASQGSVFFLPVGIRSPDVTDALSVLSNQLSVETAARIAGDNALSARVDTVSNGLSSLSQALSVLSQANSAAHAALSSRIDTVSNGLSALSQALSVLSQANSVQHAALSARIDTVSNNLSALSQALSVLSQTNSAEHAALSARITSVAAAGGGASSPPIGMNNNPVTISATTLTDVASLVTSASVGGFYQLFAAIMVNKGNATTGFKVGLSFPNVVAARGRVYVATSALQGGVGPTTSVIGHLVGWNGESARGSVLVSTISVATLSTFVEIVGVLNVSAGGPVKVKLGTHSGGAGQIIVRPGSFIRLFKLA